MHGNVLLTSLPGCFSEGMYVMRMCVMSYNSYDDSFK